MIITRDPCEGKSFYNLGNEYAFRGTEMVQRSAIQAGIPHALRGAANVLIVGLALLGLPAQSLLAADAAGIDTKALAFQTQRLANDAGQFFMAWWVPPALFQSIIRDTGHVAQADSNRMNLALQPYLVFALSRGQVGEHGLEDVHDRADLLHNSHLTVDGQSVTAAPADQDDPNAKAALDLIKPALVAMLGQNGRGIEFALYRSPPGLHTVDPREPGHIEYHFYRKHFLWQLPVWGPAAPLPAHDRPAPLPAAPSVAVAPVAATTAGATAAAAAVVPSRAPPSAPLPVQRRKIDPTTGEEFPERYDYNPYTGQKLVSQ